MNTRAVALLLLGTVSSACGDGSRALGPADAHAGSPATTSGAAGLGGMNAGGAGGAEPAGAGATGETMGGTSALGGAGGGTSGTNCGMAASAAAGHGGAPGVSGGAGSSGAAGVAGAGGAMRGPLSILVFSKTAGFRHDSIPDGIAALMSASSAAGYTMTASEDASVFTDDGLASLDVVVFLSTTGDILDDAQQAAFEHFIMSGKGFVGIHSATDTEYDWQFYGGLVGAYFREHPAVQPATLNVEDPSDPSMAGVPSPWTRTDEWYAFKSNPRPNVHVLMTLDESSYSPGTATMDGDHPITWCHEYEGGRAFYTALGHTKESYSDPIFVGILTRAIQWAGGRL